MRQSRRHLLITLLATLTLLPGKTTAKPPASFIDQLPQRSVRLAGYTPHHAIALQRHTPATPVEGIWRLTSGTLISIQRVEATDSLFPIPAGTLPPEARLRIVVLSSPNTAVRPGTVMGHIIPTATTNTYEARIYTRSDATALDDGILTSPQRVHITLHTDPPALRFHPVHTGLKINWTRILPFPFRRALQWQTEDRDGLDGATRPHTTRPRYL